MPLELIKYLSEYFYTKDELISASKVTAGQLEKYQGLGVMPAPSYKVNLNVNCDSFFGEHEELQELEFYAKGYVSWLDDLLVLQQKFCQEIQFKNEVFKLFYQRYCSEQERLKSLGYECNDFKLVSEIDAYIKEAWGHFIQGTYGLCTKSGLPEDIAAKVVAIFKINRLSELDELSQAELTTLEKAVNLLDKSSALFAPHERPRSSRHRLVNEIRRRFKLGS